MTYQDSLKNIENIKNFISIFDVDYIWFNFKDNFEFLVLFYDKNNLNELQSLVVEKNRSNLPTCTISVFDDDDQILCYRDKNMSYHYSLNRNCILLSDVRLDIDMQQVRKELAMLFNMLKK